MSALNQQTMMNIPLNQGGTWIGETIPCSITYSIHDVSDYSNGIVNTQMKAFVNSGIINFNFINDSDQIGVVFNDSGSGIFYTGVNNTGYSFAPKDLYDIASNTASLWITYVDFDKASGEAYSYRSSTRREFSYKQAIIIGIGNNPFDKDSVRVVITPQEEAGFLTFQQGGRYNFDFICASSDLLYDTTLYQWGKTLSNIKMPQKQQQQQSSSLMPETSTGNLFRNLLLFFIALGASVAGIGALSIVSYILYKKIKK